MEQNKRMRILMCQNSTEGILCGVYEAFTSRYGHAWQKLAVGPYVNGDLFSDIYSVEVNTEKAGLMVLELLAKSGTKVYYAGDLDPEGILIAQKLSRYYKGEFHYWHMETEDYEKCKSEEVISPKRMKILERITDDRLKPVVERIKAYGTAGYQEMLMEETK